MKYKTPTLIIKSQGSYVLRYVLQNRLTCYTSTTSDRSDGEFSLPLVVTR
jgi:hypothetical protein